MRGNKAGGRSGQVHAPNTNDHHIGTYIYKGLVIGQFVEEQVTVHLWLMQNKIKNDKHPIKFYIFVGKVPAVILLESGWQKKSCCWSNNKGKENTGQKRKNKKRKKMNVESKERGSSQRRGTDTSKTIKIQGQGKRSGGKRRRVEETYTFR